MNNAVSLTGEDTIQIDSRILNDLADGDCVKIIFPNDKAVLKVGKNGNTIYAQNAEGERADIEIRLLAGSADDRVLSSRLAEQNNDFSSFILVTATFVKRVSDGAGNVASIVYPFFGGIFKKNVETKTASEGDTEQSVAIYTLSMKLQPARTVQ